jgi:hypothetical protein
MGLAILMLSLAAAAAVAQTHLLHGSVTDAKTGDVIISANIHILGTTRGTISNVEGAYALTMPEGSAIVVFSYIGYQSDTARIDLKADLQFDAKLTAAPVVTPEVVVLAEDPAIEIIRQAIAHKHQWMDRLSSYTFEAFSRQELRRDSAIASITEAYSTGYMKTGDTLREIVTHKRQTENIPGSENFAAVDHVINFNEDRIHIFKVTTNSRGGTYTFVGPTAPDALENYDYKLLKTSSQDGVDVYTIRMTPKSRLKPLFDGTIVIADKTFAVIGVDLTTNDTFIVPFLRDIDLHCVEKFALYDTSFWMPSDIRITGGFTVSIIGFSLPRIGIDVSNAIYQYDINTPILDSILHAPRVRVDSSSAMQYDSAYWNAHEVLPLTAEERKAYATLDSTQTLDKQFAPKGPLSSIGGNGGEGFLDNIDVRYNRVEGFYTGLKFIKDTLGEGAFQHVSLWGSGGFAYAQQDVKYSLGVEVYATAHRTLGFGAETYRRLANTPDGGYYAPITMALMALIDKDDYRDYYLAQGWRSFIDVAPSGIFKSTVSFVDEHELTQFKNSNFTFFGSGNFFRPNPPIADGFMRAFRLDARYGDEEEPLDLISRNAVAISVEHSSPSFANSSYDFTRYDALLDYHVDTFAQDLLFSPMLRLRAVAGTSTGDLPPQLLFEPDTRASGLAPFGVLRGADVKEFAGDRYVAVSLEHNFRSLPFLALNIPSFYRNGIELVADGAFAQTWYGNVSTSNGWYAEAGLGLSRIFELARIDLTYRITTPAGFHLSVAVSNLF